MSESNPVAATQPSEETVSSSPTGSIEQRGTEGGENAQKAEGRTMKKTASAPEPEAQPPVEGRGGESGSIGTKRQGREFIKR